MTCEDETQGQRSHDGEGGLTELHTGGGHHSPVDPYVTTFPRPRGFESRLLFSRSIFTIQ